MYRRLLATLYRSRRPSRPLSHRPSARRLCCELLDDRWLLAVFTVNDPSDTIDANRIDRVFDVLPDVHPEAAGDIDYLLQNNGGF